MPERQAASVPTPSGATSAPAAHPADLLPPLPASAQAALAAAERLTTTWQGHRMVWHAWGQGEPLVVLHGGSGSWLHWVHNVQAIAAMGRRVLAADLPGFGDSDKISGADDADALAEPLGDAITQLCGPAPVDVLAFSFSSLVCGYLHHQQPERFRRLILVGAPGLLGPRGERLPLVGWAHLPTRAMREAAHRKNLALLMLKHADSLTDEAVAVQAHNASRDRMRKRKLAMSDAPQRLLGALRCPVDAIYGADDVLYAGEMDTLHNTLRALPPFGRFVTVPDAGHWVQFERPAAFAEALAPLLSQEAP